MGNESGIGGFRAGMSGNPGGRPRSMSTMQLEARKHAIEAIQELARLIREGESGAVRVAAAREILDRGFGKATAAVDIELTVNKRISELSLDELAELEMKLTMAATMPALTYDEPEQVDMLDSLEPPQ